MKARTKDIFFDQLVEGLEASVQYSKGMLSLRTTVLPEPPPVPKPEQIQQLRERHKMSQSIFAATLNVNKKTVQAWEQGQRVPNQAATRLIQIFENEPQLVVRIVSGIPPKSPKAVSAEGAGKVAKRLDAMSAKKKIPALSKSKSASK